MATVHWHRKELTGATLTLKLYPLTSSDIANGVSGDVMTEAGGLFSATVEETLTGWHKAYAEVGGAIRADGWVNMDDPEPVVNEAVAGTLEASDLPTIPNPLMVSLLYGEEVPRAFGFKGELYLGEIAPNVIRVLERSPSNSRLSAKNLSGIESISLEVVDYAGNTVQHVANAGLDRSDDVNGNLGWTNDAPVTSSERKLRAFVWNDAGPVLLMEGSLTIKYAKHGA